MRGAGRTLEKVDLFDDGRHLLRGTLRLLKVTPAGYEVTLSYGASAVMAKLKAVKLRDLDLGGLRVWKRQGNILDYLGELTQHMDDVLASLLGQMLRWQTLVGLCFYGSGTMFYVVALRRIPMSIALPCTAVSYVSATLFGLLLFHEAMTPVKFGGLLLVCAGVVLLAEFGGRRPVPAAAA